MAACEFTEAGEAEIDARHGAGIHGGSESLAIVAAMNPARRKTDRVGGGVIVEEALRHMQEPALRDTQFPGVIQQVLEVARVRLVGTDVLRGVDRIEGDTQPARTIVLHNEIVPATSLPSPIV